MKTGGRTSGSFFFRNVSAVIGSRAITILSQIMVLPIIARYLTVEDFGAVALAMSIVIFAQILSDAGLGRSLVRQPEVVPLEWDTVFWLLVAVGIGLTVCLAISAPLWASIFELPAMTGLVVALSVTPFLQAVAAVPAAQLERENRFQMLALVRTIGVALALAATVWLAVIGAGAWALVAQQIVLFVTIAIGTFAVSTYRPKLRFSRAGLSTHLVFARDNIGTSLLFTGQKQGPPLLIGYFLGAGPLGLFAMSQRLLNLPQTGIAGPASQVVFVRMTRSLNQPNEVGALYIASMRILALLTIPPVAILAATGPTLFPWILSEDWAAVAIIFALAAPGITLEAVCSPAGVMFQATGQTTLRLKMATERAIAKTTAVALAVPFGLEATALVMTAFSFVYLPRFWHYANQAASFDRQAAIKAIALPLVVSLLVCITLVIVSFGADVASGAMVIWGGLALLVSWVLSAWPQRQKLKEDAAKLAARSEVGPSAEQSKS